MSDSMVQNKIIQVDVAFLTYDPKRCASTPQVKQDNACIVGLEDLKRHREVKRREKDKMGAEAYHHYKWYNSMLAYEIKSLTENSKLKVIHWHIDSGNTEAFMMGGKLYKNVSIIIGDLMEHWYCANVGRDATHSYGSRFRKNTDQPQISSKKVAVFTVDDDEATLVNVMKDDSIQKCTPEICANNCLECKKFRSPFSKNNKHVLCACFPAKEEFKSIDESDCDDESDNDDIAQLPLSSVDRKSYVTGRYLTGLKSIREE